MVQRVFDDIKNNDLAGTEQEVHFITKVLNLPNQASILDLYCGYGRHAIELAKLGFLVTGIDATTDFLNIASQKAKEAKVNLSLVQRDMRELDYNEKFDAVINMFAAFGYFSDDENAQVLKRVANALCTGGLFLIDLLNREWMIRNNLNRYWRHPNGEYVLSYKVELQQGVTTMKRQLINQVTGVKTQYEFVLRTYSLTEMTNILQHAGLKVVNMYGGFDSSPYNSDSPRMIILAKK
jgi:2-polyprenyl-3-methyl-5-hydroxy-6-metoxy-1,4-benzoquinol methylase